MSSARDIIQDALERLGVYAPGETMTDADAERGLIKLNDMLNQWGDDYLFVYQLVPTAITLVIGTASYTIGVSGATITQSRPTKINSGPGGASVLIGSTTSLVNVVSAIEWASIEGIVPGTGTPENLYYDPQYPNGVLNVSPTPDAVGSLTFQAWQPLRSFASLDIPASTVNYAAGAEETMKSNLAMELKPYFSDSQLNPAVMMAASEGKMALRQTNITSRAMLSRGIVRQPPRQAPAGP